MNPPAPTNAQKPTLEPPPTLKAPEKPAEMAPPPAATPAPVAPAPAAPKAAIEPEKPVVPPVPAGPAVPAPAAPGVPPTPAKDSPFGMNNGLRTWSDATGQYRLEARLVSVQDNLVRLCNAEGKFFRIAMQQLSPADQQFVRAQAQTVATAW
jgi:outer membrane biosynthesis protein TonB